MARTEGQRIVLMTGLILNVVGLANLIISFITPYWVITWPRVFYGFRKIGLWEVCFAGNLNGWDPSQKSYHGCWWILAPELYSIRSWIMPPWFICIQILITISLVIEVIALVFDIRVWSHTSERDKSGMMGKRRAPYKIVNAMTIITIITTVLKSIAVIGFGFGFKFDWFWVIQQPNIAYPHVSYGLAIVSTFFSFFSSIAHVKYRQIIWNEYHQPAIPELNM